MFNINFLKWRKVNDTGVSTLKEAKEFIKNNSMETFLYERRMIEMEIAWEYSIYSVKLFFLYLMCSILIYIIFDKDSINLMLYNGMSYMGIPVRSSNGWNVLYLLSIVFNLYIFIVAFWKENPRWIKKVIFLSSSQKNKILFSKTCIALLCLPISLICIYVMPDFKGKTCTSLWNLCFLYTDDMFIHTVIIEYFACAYFFYIIYLLLFMCNLRMVI